MAFTVLFSCKKEALPEPNYTISNSNSNNDIVVVSPKDTTATTNDSVIVDPVVVDPVTTNDPVIVDPVTTNDPITEDPIVTSPEPITTMKINFLVNFQDDGVYPTNNTVFRVYDENWKTYATLKAANLISVNTESWACNNDYHKMVTYTDNNFTPNKTYHLVAKVFVGANSSITNDFTFQVDENGNIINLTTENISYVENKFGTQINDVSLKCNKIIINHRRIDQDPKIQGDL